MTNKDLWELTYLSVLAMRLHPRNDGDATRLELLEEARRFARLAAHTAVLDSQKEHTTWHGSEQQSAPQAVSSEEC